MKVGDLVVMLIEPGGVCLITAIFTKDKWSYTNFWGEEDFPILQLVHPTLGLIEEPAEFFHPYPIRKEIKTDDRVC